MVSKGNFFGFAALLLLASSCAVLASDFLAFDGGFWLELAAFSLTLNDYDDAAFGGVSLPVTPPDLAPFEDATLGIVLWIAP